MYCAHQFSDQVQLHRTSLQLTQAAMKFLQYWCILIKCMPFGVYYMYIPSQVEEEGVLADEPQLHWLRI